MTLHEPIYRYTVSQPRSEDPTESTVMRPISGAAHSDFFAVATKELKAYGIDLPGNSTSEHIFVDPVGTWPTTELTISMWVKPDAIGVNDRAFFSYSDGTQHNEILGIIVGNAGTVRWLINNTAILTTGSIQIDDGEWHHVLFRWRNSDGLGECFIDGVLGASNTNQETSHTITGVGYLSVGQEQDSRGGGFQASQAMAGEVAYVRVWNRFLTTGVMSNKQDLVLKWELDEGTGTAVDDTSPGGTNDGTITGSPPWVQGGPLNFKPYLAEVPRGRRGELNVLKAQSSIGRLSLKNLDKKIGSDVTDNLTRWFTAFAGSVSGRDRFRGDMVFVEESLDDGATWSDFYTGRIAGWATERRLLVTLTLRDLADDLERRVFVGTPGVTDAALPYLCPLGLPIAYGGKSATAKIEAEFQSGSGRNRKIVIRNTALGINHPGNVVTRELTDGAEKAFSAASLEGYTITEQARLEYDNGTDTGKFKVVAIVTRPQAKHRSIAELIIAELDSSDPDYLAFPSSTENTDIAIVYSGPPTEARPLFINNRHPATLLEELLLGKFSRLDGDGNPYWVYPMDTATFTTFKADLTFKTGRWVVTDEAKLGSWVEAHLGQAFGVGFRFDPNGHIKPIDLRTPTGLAPPTISQSDLVAGVAPVWENAGEPITQVRATWFTESTLQQQTIENKEDTIPDLPTSRIRLKDQILEIIEANALTDLGDNRHDIEAVGYRTFERELQFGTIRSAWNRRQLEARMRDVLRIFARGPNVATFATRRTAAVSGANLCLPGDYRVVDVDELPDPSTNLRGGPRLMLCISREEQGPAIRFKFLDSGVNVTAGVPTYTSLALTTGDEQHGVTSTVAPNAEDDPIEIQYAITATLVSTRPVEASDLWTYGATVFTTTSTTRDIDQLPAGMRIWTRIRSVPRWGSGAIRQPSAWVFPATPAVGYVDTSALAVPTGTAESNITNEGATLSWSVGDVTLPLELLFGPDGGPLVSVALLPAGSTQISVGGLAQNTTYDWEIRHFDRSGSVGATAADTFTTLNVSGTPAPNTGVPIVIIGANERGGEVIDLDREPDELLTGIFIELRPTDATLGMVLEQSSVTAGSNVVEIARLEPGITGFVRLLPIDGVDYFFRTKHIGPNFDEAASGWSAWSADASPTMLPDGILELAPYTGSAGVNSAQPERLIAPVGTDRWGVLE